VDFEHERREEVIQYIYAKYGRERAAIAAVVITYRTRSVPCATWARRWACPEALVNAFAKEHHWFDEELAADRLQSWHSVAACLWRRTVPGCGWSWPAAAWVFRAT
jgi:error-prone DNA polymerase